ncbi:unnamed protein product [Chondrus crispus]|uniref:Uncharacterized protein n=1 Tax=Chondrus crispus TaxID=2769 RepID=R7QMV4_CHOCR|nr:unnamed protein product [Chondrus crispus]CDF38715.1 unnamed protein product [Chondrus crispus]|eukprot:XP_005718620.1 unnamed protein product [Chondrus crispus]
MKQEAPKAIKRESKRISSHRQREQHACCLHLVPERAGGPIFFGF